MACVHFASETGLGLNTWFQSGSGDYG